MRLPLSPKMLLRLHRKIFMLRRPGTLARRGYSLTLAPGKKAPILSLQVEKRRMPVFTVLAVVGALAAMAWLTLRE